MTDYENAVREFNCFLQNYDVNDGKIRLKIIHTYHVASLAERIAREISLSEEEVQLARLIGLLHDIGRFEQIKRYHTFVDGKSVDHAALGVEILQNNHFISRFCRKEDERIVLTAVANHNRFRIEDGLDRKTLVQCRVIRDADKTDIFRVRIEDPVADALPCDQETLEKSTITPYIFDEFMRGHSIHKADIRTNLDIWIMGLAFIYDYNYPQALAILEEKDYINKQIDRLQYHDPETAARMESVRNQCHAYIQKRMRAAS